MISSKAMKSLVTGETMGRAYAECNLNKRFVRDFLKRVDLKSKVVHAKGMNVDKNN